jgi:hypothetical protein
MQRSDKRGSRRLTLESLESRLPLAGNVTATVVDGKLTVLGDAQANVIVIEEVFFFDAGPGFQVRGLAGTTINGASSAFRSFDEVRDILVSLGRGNDRMVIAEVGVVSSLEPGPIFVSDPISRLIQEGPVLVGSPGNANIAGQLTINLSDGNDTAIVYATAGEGIAIEAGAGDDQFYHVDDAAHDTGPLRVRMGEGNDLASVTVFNASQQIDLQTANGNDQVFATLATPTQLTVHTGIGDDNVYVARLEGGRWSSLPAGDRQIAVRTGLGNDSIGVTRVSAGALLINAGLGRDAVRVSALEVTGNVTIHGGGLYGSTVKVSDAYIEPLGYTSTSPLAQRYSPVRIGGDLQIDFNVDSQAPDQPRTPFSVVLGSEGQSQAIHDAIIVGGRVRVFGTVRADDVSLANLTAGSIELYTGHGWDAISLAGIKTAGNVAAYLGEGNDRSLVVEDFRTAATSSRLGDSDIAGAIVPTTIGGDLIVDYGAGDEHFSSTNLLVPTIWSFRIGATHSQLTNNFVVSGQLLLSGGDGLDDLQILAATLGSAKLQFDAGPSRLDLRYFLVRGDALLSGGSVSDQWSLSAFGVGGDLTLEARAGLNSIGINERSDLPSSVGGNVLFDLGDGRDLVRIGQVVAGLSPFANILLVDNGVPHFFFPTMPGGGELTVGGRLTLTGRGGDDTVKLDHLKIRARLFAFLGDGDDVLEMRTTSAGGVVDGGIGGNDRLEGLYEPTTSLPLLRTNWEIDNLVVPVVRLLPGVWHES